MRDITFAPKPNTINILMLYRDHNFQCLVKKKFISFVELPRAKDKFSPSESNGDVPMRHQSDSSLVKHLSLFDVN